MGILKWFLKQIKQHLTAITALIAAVAIGIALYRLPKMEPYAIYVATLLAAGLGSYLSAYLKKAGEYRAIDEQFDRVHKQQMTLAASTEAIRTELSKSAWVQQQQWQLKERCYTKILEPLLVSLRAQYEVGRCLRELDHDPVQDYKKFYATDHARTIDAIDAIRAAYATSEIFVSSTTSAALRGLEINLEIANNTCSGDHEMNEAYFCALSKAYGVISAEARRELGLEPTSTATPFTQSN